MGLRPRLALPRDHGGKVTAHEKVLDNGCLRLPANTDPPSLRYGATSPQRACRAEAGRRRKTAFFTKGPPDMLDHATSEIASGSKLGIDATKKSPGEGFKRPCRRSSRWMKT